MQVLCIRTEDAVFDLECAQCGQRYIIYYSRLDPGECARALASVHAALAEEHDAGALDHAEEAFNVPRWRGSPYSSAAALLGGAPSVRKPRAVPTPIRGADGKLRAS